jgi:hypothetical protein
MAHNQQDLRGQMMDAIVHRSFRIDDLVADISDDKDIVVGVPF